MRLNRYIIPGLLWWGCDASPDSRSIYPDSTSTSTVIRGSESDESDEERRGCGEEEDTGYDDEVLSSAAVGAWDTGDYDTGEVYYVQ